MSKLLCTGAIVLLWLVLFLSDVYCSNESNNIIEVFSKKGLERHYYYIPKIPIISILSHPTNPNETFPNSAAKKVKRLNFPVPDKNVM